MAEGTERWQPGLCTRVIRAVYLIALLGQDNTFNEQMTCHLSSIFFFFIVFVCIISEVFLSFWPCLY